MRRTFAASLLFLAAAACAPSRYRYAPVTLTNAELEGRPAVLATLPAEDPRGTLRIAPLGIAKITPPADSGATPFFALYVRMSFENASNETWIVDEAAQMLTTKWRGNDYTVHATTATGVRAPIVAIDPGASARLDMIFELPPGATTADDVEVFDVVWTVRTATSASNGRAAFQRLTAEPAVLPGVPDTNPPPQRAPGRYGPRPER